MNPTPLPDDADAQHKLQAKLVGLTMCMPSGQPSASLAAKVSGRSYKFPENDRGIQTLLLDFMRKLADARGVHGRRRVADADRHRCLDEEPREFRQRS